MSYRLALLAGLAALAGCTSARPERGERPLVSWHSSEPPLRRESVPVDRDFRLGCADVVEVRFQDMPSWDVIASVDVDGRLPLGPAGRPLVAGLTLEAVRGVVAKTSDQDRDSVSVQLVEVRSARVYIVGPDNARSGSVPYRGPELVSAYLRRAGILEDVSADLSDITLTRNNVAAGGQPQVIRIDLEAASGGDADHDPPVQPSDQITVGETWRSRLRRLLPEWVLFLIAPVES